MAQRRMFSLKVVDTDNFLEMGQGAQLLYFHLAMRADDDGFVSSPKKILRFAGAKDDDMRILILKKFIIPFQSGVIVIRHWRENNYIQSDRKHPTIYTDEMKLLTSDDNGIYDLYPKCIQNVSKMDTEVRLGEVRLREDSKEKESDKEKENQDQTPSKLGDTPKDQMQYFLENYEKVAEIIAKKKNLEYNTVNAEIKKFINYWTEKNPSGTKQRWQMQKTFEVQKRLTTWLNNAQKYNGRADTTPKVITI